MVLSLFTHFNERKGPFVCHFKGCFMFDSNDEYLFTREEELWKRKNNYFSETANCFVFPY